MYIFFITLVKIHRFKTDLYNWITKYPFWEFLTELSIYIIAVEMSCEVWYLWDTENYLC